MNRKNLLSDLLKSYNDISSGDDNNFSASDYIISSDISKPYTTSRGDKIDAKNKTVVTKNKDLKLNENVLQGGRHYVLFIDESLDKLICTEYNSFDIVCEWTKEKIKNMVKSGELSDKYNALEFRQMLLGEWHITDNDWLVLVNE